MIANLSKIVLPGVDSTLAIDVRDRHANLCGESILANIPKVYQSLSVTFRNISASVFNCVVRVIVGHGKLKAPATFKSRPRTAQLSALAKSMLIDYES